MDITIVRAMVLVGRGPDHVFLRTTLPCPYVPAALPSQPDLDIEFKTTAGKGVAYVREHFNIEPEVVEV